MTDASLAPAHLEYDRNKRDNGAEKGLEVPDQAPS